MTDKDRDHHQIEIDYKCPMDGCGLVQTARWSSLDFPLSLEGISRGDILEGSLQCPDCDENMVAHSNRFRVVEVRGEPVRTDYDPLEKSA